MEDFKDEGDRQEANAQKVAKAQEDQLLRAYQDLFLGSPEGQLVLWDLLNQCHVFREFGQYNAGAYALEGKREIGLELMRRVYLYDKLGGPGPGKMQEIISSIISADKIQVTKVQEEEKKDAS